MTDELSTNERLLQHARTAPFWAYVGLGVLVAVGGSFALEAAAVDVKIAYLAGMGAATLLEAPVDWFGDCAERRLDKPTDNTEESDP